MVHHSIKGERQPASQLASRKEEVQQLHDQLQTLRDKHEDKLHDLNGRKEGLQEDFTRAQSKVCNLKEEKRRHMEEAANCQSHIQAIFEEVRKHDSNLSHIQALYNKVEIHPTIHFSSEHRVVGLVRGILLQFQTEVKSTTLGTEKKEKKWQEFAYKWKRQRQK